MRGLFRPCSLAWPGRVTAKSAALEQISTEASARYDSQSSGLIPIASFGEQVLYKLPGKEPLSIPEANMGAKWKEVGYLGHSITSNSYMLGCPGGIEEARVIHRRPKDERWNAEALADITAKSWSLRESARPPPCGSVNPPTPMRRGPTQPFQPLHGD